MMTAFRALVRKDIQLFLGDRRAVLMTTVAPIMIGSFFGFIMGGQRGRGERSRVPILVVDEDQSVVSREIIGRLKADRALDVKPSAKDEATEALRRGKTTLAVVIPKGFGVEAGRALFGAGGKPVVGMLYDPSHSIELGMVQGILAGHVMEAVSKEMFSGSSGRQLVKEALAHLGDGAAPQANALRSLLESLNAWNEHQQSSEHSSSEAVGGLSMPFDMHEEAVTSAKQIEYNGYAHSFAGMGVQFILFMGIDVGIGMLLQRQRGLWKRLRAAPLSRGVLLGSRAVSAAIIAASILLVIFSFARVAFGVRVNGSVLGFLAVCAAFSLMTATFGLLIAALGKTPDATRGLSILVTLVLVMLGGSWVPTFVFPQWMQTLTLIVPTRWAVDGLDAMTWRGLGLSAAALPVALMSLFSFLFGGLAVRLFRWEAEGG